MVQPAQSHLAGNSLIDRIVSVWVWGSVCLIAPVMFPIALLIRVVTGPIDPQLRVLHAFTNLWGSIYCWVSPYWHVRIADSGGRPNGTAYVMVANHESIVDILVMHRTFLRFKWISKVQNFKLPFIGWNMRLNDYVPVRRGNRDSVLEMFEHATKHLDAGSSLLIFPEGSRSKDGQIKPFKTGAFELALRTKRPVLPILINGTAQALPTRGFVLQGHHNITVTVLEPLLPASFEGLTPEQLADRVRETLVEARREVVASVVVTN